MKLYKLTDSEGWTRKWSNNQCLWGQNVTHSGTGKGPLCSGGYIHAYEDPLLAVLLNPIHANYKNPLLWEAEGTIALRDDQLKCGCVTLTTIKQIPVPKVTYHQRVDFAILCALAVYNNIEFKEWANDWLYGDKETRIADAVSLADAALVEKVAWEEKTAWAAARFAAMALLAQRYSWKQRSAWAAAWAAAFATRAGTEIDLKAIAKQALLAK